MGSEEEVITASVSIIILIADISFRAKVPQRFSCRAAVSAYSMLGWSYLFCGLFRWHGRMVIRRGVHGVTSY